MNELIYQLQQQSVLQNSYLNISIFLGILLLGLILKRSFSGYLGTFFFQFIKRYAENVNKTDFVGLIKKPLEWLIAIWIFYFAFSFLEFPSYWNLRPSNQFGLLMLIEKGYQLAIFISTTWMILRLIDFIAIVLSSSSSNRERKLHEQLIPFMREFFKIIVLLFSFFLFLGIVFNMNVASIITGLGIGGLAVALAAKESLENLLASFTIFLDKPFVVGDLVKIGNITGVVERVGFRSTRIRTLEKSLVSMPNKKMVDDILDNLSSRVVRRVKFNVGIATQSKQESIFNFVSDLKKYVSENEYCEKDNYIYFQGFADNLYSIQVLYFVNTTDEKLFNQTKENINLEIVKLAHIHTINIELQIR